MIAIIPKARILICIVLSLAAAGCTMRTQAYHNSAALKSDLADFDGYKAQCSGNLVIRRFDKEFDGTKLSAPAGQHTMEVCYQSSPYLRDEPRYRVDELCTDLVRFNVTLQAKPRLTYYFDVDGNPRSDRSLTVRESIGPGAVESKPVPASITRISRRQVCYPDLEQRTCLDLTYQGCSDPPAR